MRLDRDVAPKKNEEKKSVWDHNFDILEVKYGVLLEMVSFFFFSYFFGNGQNTIL
jgi:hypothetical protein